MNYFLLLIPKEFGGGLIIDEHLESSDRKAKKFTDR